MKKEYEKIGEVMIVKSIDIFCEVIDNYGDVGFAYRLGKELREEYDSNVTIRIFFNRLDELRKINKKIKDVDFQEIDGIIYILNEFLDKKICTFSPSDVIIECFGCNVHEKYLEKAKKESALLINLEYLSGELWIEEAHLMESPLGAEKLKKYFFMPGFNEKTGGIILDKKFLETKKNVLENKKYYLQKYFPTAEEKNYFIGTIFSYEKNFMPLIGELEKNEKENLIFILGEKSQESIKEILKKLKVEICEDEIKYKNILFKFMPFLSQEEYGELVNIADYNFVRGEDSLTRGILTGKPFIWHIYCQSDMNHMVKILEFIERYKDALNGIDAEALKTHTELLNDYNYRDTNSLDIGTESFQDFFNNFERIKKLTEKYSEYIQKNCNLIDKLNKFILKY